MIIDLANPKTNWNKTPGYTEAETSSFARILNTDESGEDHDPKGGKFVDVWRKLHPDLRHYTYFSYRFNCREKGLGWRLDMCTYTFVTASLRLISRVCGQVTMGPGGCGTYDGSLTSCLCNMRSCCERAAGRKGEAVRDPK